MNIVTISVATMIWKLKIEVIKVFCLSGLATNLSTFFLTQGKVPKVKIVQIGAKRKITLKIIATYGIYSKK